MKFSPVPPFQHIFSGQELVFLRLAVSAALFGPFAMVENEMVFQNPENRTMEGHWLSSVAFMFTCLFKSTVTRWRAAP